MDDDNSKSLNKYEFNKALTDYMLGFSAAENGALFEYFDWTVAAPSHMMNSSEQLEVQ